MSNTNDVKQVQQVDARSSLGDRLRRVRQGVPPGNYHVDRDALRAAKQDVPQGEYHVDREALREARAGVPDGSYH